MKSSFSQIYVHIVFHVKSHGILMRTDDLNEIYKFIGGIIVNLGATPLQIGGTNNHIHILSTLPKDITLIEFVKKIKANSSRWLSKKDWYYNKFSWQEGYGAFSVSASVVESTIQYIKNQFEHHRKCSFTEEYRHFLDAYHIQYDEQILPTE